LLTTLHKDYRVRVVPIESVYKAIRSALRKLDAALRQYERKTIRRWQLTGLMTTSPMQCAS